LPGRADYLTGTNNYTRFALDPGARSVKVRFHDKNDAILGERTYPCEAASGRGPRSRRDRVEWPSGPGGSFPARVPACDGDASRAWPRSG
jgi:hypothetical protein